MINHIHIPLDSTLAARISEASKHYDIDEKGLLLRALEDFLNRDEIIRQELTEDDERLQNILKHNNGIEHKDIIKWIDEEIYDLNFSLNIQK